MTFQLRRRPGSVSACGVWLALVAVSCSRDPGVTYAQRLERAASWAASVQFTLELAQQDRVPPAYVREVLTTAAREVATLERQIAADDQVPARAREEAMGWCKHLSQLFGDGGRSGEARDSAAVRDLETRLRSAAKLARGGTLMD